MVCMSMWLKLIVHMLLFMCLCAFDCFCMCVICHCVELCLCHCQSVFYIRWFCVFLVISCVRVCVGLLSQEVHWTLSLFLHISKQTVKRDAAQG